MNTSFFQQKFSEYYAKHRDSINVPEARSREYGAGVNGKIDFRHVSFPSNDALRDFLIQDAPLYASYSAARYERPAAKPMPNKGFVSADLVFDLDKTYAEEHPEKHGAAFCPHCLERARQDAARFYDEFLLKDYGFGKSDVAINFSGSKGYHFHIRTPAVQQLSSAARKELCDYAGALEVSPEKLVTKQAGALVGPSAASSGWSKKVFNYAQQFALTADTQAWRAMGAGSRTAKHAAQNNAELASRLERGDWSWKNLEKSFTALATEAIRKTRVELDAPVTFDLSRLIRIPNTLHGDSCLTAKVLQSLDAFAPDKDAVAFRGAIEVTPNKTLALEFGGTTFELEDGKTKELPLAAGLLLLRKGYAVLVGL
ncbi:hypothetical protein AUJ14_05880 [Candidatus Micrarchaeota archaeon CG1_02_55_22]|nr:MAG: hypothetical protein AUJ14_05880 [Candidatus Micrarchaeota archaeon CG1_02_55_22]